MKVAELKEELEARNEAKWGNKAWLRRRLHTTIVHEHLEASAQCMDSSDDELSRYTGRMCQ